MQTVVLLETNPRDKKIVRAGHQPIAGGFETRDGIDRDAPFDVRRECSTDCGVRFDDQNAFGAREASRSDAQMLIKNASVET